MKKTNKKPIKKQNKTRKIGGVIQKRQPTKQSLIQKDKIIVNKKKYKLSDKVKRLFSRNSWRTLLPKYVLEQSTIHIKKIYTKSVFSRVFLIDTEINGIILKLCIITPETVVLPTVARLDDKQLPLHKETVSEEEFKREYSYLEENSMIGICPEPFFMEIYDYQVEPISKIMKKIAEELTVRPDKEIYTVLFNIFQDMRDVIKSNPEMQVKYGIIGMEYIDGEPLYLYWRHIPHNKIRELSVKIVSLILRLHMNGYANFDCNETNIIVKPDGEPIMIDFGQVETREKGLNLPIDSHFTVETTPENVFDSYKSILLRLGIPKTILDNEIIDNFLRKFILTDEKLTLNDFDEFNGDKGLKLQLAITCICYSSKHYSWMMKYGIFNFMFDDTFIEALKTNLREHFHTSS